MSTHETQPTRPVTIVVLTFRREYLLPALIEQLRNELAAAEPLPEHSGVLVVDNDPDGSAGAVVAQMHGVRYAHEAYPGIAAARQRALDEVPTHHLMVFIDDDESPVPGWLGLLLDAWAVHGHPAGVAGRVVPRFESEPDPFVIDGRFFERTLAPTGTEVLAAGAGNLLLDLEQVHGLGLTFDRRLGLRGGEDTLFTRQLTARGGRLIRCREAEAFDLVPPERATRAWVLRRAFSQAGATTMVALTLASGSTGRLRARLRLLLGGLLRIPAGLLVYLESWVTGSRYQRARGPWLVAKGAGLVAGSLGVSAEEYRRTGLR